MGVFFKEKAKNNKRFAKEKAVWTPQTPALLGCLKGLSDMLNMLYRIFHDSFSSTRNLGTD